MELLLLVAGGYLLGSVPVGYLTGKYWKGVDLREKGSGNIGTTNAMRVLGRLPGLLVFVGDFLKGWLPCWLGIKLGGEVAAILAGLAAVGGHNWPLFLGFRGGRGVATGAGVIFALNPWVLAAAVFVWLVTLALTRYVSVGSIAAAATVPLSFLVLFFLGYLPFYYFLAGVVFAFFIIYRHRPNIARLRRGEEFRIGKK